MLNAELITIGAVVIFTLLLAYKSRFLHSKKLGYISLLQIFYLILAPGLIYTIIFSYLLEVIRRPLNQPVFLNDRLLVSLLLLSILYTYGGLVIHSISKTLASYFAKNQKNSLVYRVNKYFHLSFSHNLSFTGAVASATLFSLLELNHLSPYPQPISTPIALLNGLIIGLSLIISLAWFKQRWLDLKFFFFSVWAMLVVFVYAIKPYIKSVNRYPFSLMMLVTFCWLAGLSLFLYIRRHKNKLKFIWRWPKKLF